jgi:hypothetical protein
MASITRLDDSTVTERAVKLHAGLITTAFGVAIAVLATAHVLFQWIRYDLGMPEFYGLVRLFDMGVEANLPTFFSAFQLLIVCLLLVVVGLTMRQRRDRYARHWLVLALIFFLLAADEMAEVHEMTIRPIREIAPWLVTGLFYWAWVIPAAILVAVVAFSYAKFVFAYLPPDLRKATLIGAAIFVGGAVGVEMPEAMFAQVNGIENFTYALFVLLEETMEMAGILVFLSGLLRYFSRQVGVVAMQVVPAPMAAPAIAPSRFPATRRPAL